MQTNMEALIAKLKESLSSYASHVAMNGKERKSMANNFCGTYAATKQSKSDTLNVVTNTD